MFKRLIGTPNAAVFHKHRPTYGALAFGIGVTGESAGPGDIAMADGIQGVTALDESPSGAGVAFTQRKVIGSDVLVATGEPLFAHGELIHKGEAEVVLFPTEIYFEERTGKL